MLVQYRKGLCGTRPGLLRKEVGGCQAASPTIPTQRHPSGPPDLRGRPRIPAPLPGRQGAEEDPHLGVDGPPGQRRMARPPHRSPLPPPSPTNPSPRASPGSSTANPEVQGPSSPPGWPLPGKAQGGPYLQVGKALRGPPERFGVALTPGHPGPPPPEDGLRVEADPAGAPDEVGVDSLDGGGFALGPPAEYTGCRGGRRGTCRGPARIAIPWRGVWRWAKGHGMPWRTSVCRGYGRQGWES